MLGPEHFNDQLAREVTSCLKQDQTREDMADQFASLFAKFAERMKSKLNHFVITGR